MKKTKPDKRLYPLIPLSDIHEALTEADRRLKGECPAVSSALMRLRECTQFWRGDLVEYQELGTDKWVRGVVVAHMVCEPRYICITGDNATEVRGKKGLACRPPFIRPRSDRTPQERA